MNPPLAALLARSRLAFVSAGWGRRWSTLLWMMAGRTGVPLIDDEFDPRPVRRKEAVPIMTFAEMFGME